MHAMRAKHLVDSPQCRYSPDGQILGICSRMKSKACAACGWAAKGLWRYDVGNSYLRLRLVHSGTATVFQNWPTEKTPLDRADASER